MWGSLRVLSLRSHERPQFLPAAPSQYICLYYQQDPSLTSLKGKKPQVLGKAETFLSPQSYESFLTGGKRREELKNLVWISKYSDNIKGKSPCAFIFLTQYVQRQDMRELMRPLVHRSLGSLKEGFSFVKNNSNLQKVEKLVQISYLPVTQLF